MLDPLWQIGPSADLYGAALDVRGRYGFSFYDALIVASALAAGCTRLLSEDLQHGRRVGDLTIVDPIRASPALARFIHECRACGWFLVSALGFRSCSVVGVG